MIIKKMTATFGALDKQTLELKPGLNVIEAGNESGKSTWCAFIRAMLYGVRTSERVSAGNTPDKIRYLPWSGAGMEGTMTVLHEGTEYELTRLPKQGILGDCSATFAGTAERAQELCGKSPGEVLVGASEDVFRRSAFISHGAMRVENSGELEKRISELVSAGEENYSFEDAYDRISKFRKKIKNSRGGGALPEAEREAARLKSELHEIENASESSVTSESERARLAAAAEKMEQYITAKEKWDKKLGMRRLNAAREMEKAKKLEYEQAASAVEENGVSEGAIALARDAQSAADECQNKYDTCRAALKEVPQPDESGKNRHIFGFIAAGLGAVMTAAGAVTANFILLAAGVLVLAAGLVIAITGRKKYREQLSQQQRALSQAESALTAAENELKAAAERRDRLLGELRCTPEEGEKLLKKVKTAENEYDAASRAAASLEYLQCDDPDIENAEEPAGTPANRELLEHTRARMEELARLAARMDGERAHLGDPAVIATKLKAVRERAEELQEYEDSIIMAESALEEASREMQNRFAPIVGARAAELLSFMTDGRYAAISFDRGMSFKTRLSGDAVSRDSVFLSEGTADQMYLAVRLAICSLVLDGDEPCPIILDDALACFDDARAEQAMKLLTELAADRQIILFTCRARDAEIAEKLRK